MNPTVSAQPGHDRGISKRVPDHYANHSPFSTPGRHAALFDALPCNPAGVARTAQGLLIYEHVAEPVYGCPIPEARRTESHIRPMEKIIDALLVLDGRPLEVARCPEKRLVGICHHFMLLSLAILRHHSVSRGAEAVSEPTSTRESSRITGLRILEGGGRSLGAAGQPVR
jgi:hypothetical protein